jgi:hypothetical protein
MDVAVACMYPTQFSLPIHPPRSYFEANQRAIVITDIVGDKQGELEVRRPSSGVSAPPSIFNACANEFGYLKMGTKTDSSGEPAAIGTMSRAFRSGHCHCHELPIECLTLNSGVSIFTRRCFSVAPHVSL